jgi:hypothetical protein
MVNWLKKRLSPVKRDTAMWQELAEGIQEYWDTLFLSELVKAQNLRSVYSADGDGRRLIVAELGGYVEQDLLQENMPITVGVRKLEMHQKETDLLIRRTLQAAAVSGVQWLPLYALESDGAYGTKFYDGVIDLIPSGAYMTSRGKILIEQTLLNDPDKIEKLESQVVKLKPLHIVYDGILFVSAVTGDLFEGTSYQSSETTTVYPD